MALVVQKFGGTSVANIEKIKNDQTDFNVEEELISFGITPSTQSIKHFYYLSEYGQKIKI